MKRGWREAGLVVASLVMGLLLLEGFARAWIVLRWPEERIEQMTAGGYVRGRFELGGPTGYRLRRAHRTKADGKVFTHDALGYRGAGFSKEKPPGQVRIALVGASTLYGLAVSDEESSAAVLQRSLQNEGYVLVVNAAVPGWLSEDNAANLEERVLSLSPDVIVVMDGRNEVWAEAFAGYREDYGHYMMRDPESIAAVQSGLRRAFRLSGLAMIAGHRFPTSIGYRPELFSPVYARVRWENAPTAEQVIAFAAEPDRFDRFRSNQEAIVLAARRAGAVPVLATLAFDPDRYETGLLPNTPEALEAERRMVLANIAITREVAAKHSVLLFDAFALTRPEMMHDDCHPNERGEEMFGAALAELIRPEVKKRAAR